MGEMFECVLFTASLAKVCQHHPAMHFPNYMLSWITDTPVQLRNCDFFVFFSVVSYWHLRAGLMGALSLRTEVNGSGKYIVHSVDFLCLYECFGKWATGRK